MRKITLLLIMCLALLSGCFAPAEIPVPTPVPELPSFPSVPDLPNLPITPDLPDVLPTEEEVVVEEPIVEEPVIEEQEVTEPVVPPQREEEPVVVEPPTPVVEEPIQMFSMANWHPHPSVVGLPEEIPAGYLPEPGTEVERYLTLPKLNCEDIGGGVYIVGFDDTFFYKEDRGLPNLVNPSYEELVNFLAVDRTDERPSEVRYWVWSEETPGKKEYITEAEVEALKAKGDGNYYTEFVFSCTDFSLMLRENANALGWRCASVALPTVHTINAFETTDRGLVLVGNSDVLLGPVITRYDPYPVPFGDEAKPRSTPQEGIIVYVW